ncbi:alkaline phosphatase family protein [Streptomyces sp. NPDC035033]|uniref:alkaline phosphatase family protein n=1 Tax=Streptomyces sp. NPDC035033 TaxID=3155368 RepID=UPI0033D616A3
MARSSSGRSTTVDAADHLRNGNPDSAFVHLDAVDGAGHDFGGTGRRYRDAIRTADGQVGRIVAAVKARATYAGENWLIMVTTDHGHVDEGGHGGNDPNVRKSFVIANGAGIAAGSKRHDVKIADVAATVLKHTGVAIEPSWGLDGIPIQDLAPDAFDGLRGSLRTRVDETGTPDPIAADAVGFTRTPSADWSVDDSAMPSGGVTEGRGRTFSTGGFWSFSECYQGRESHVRARDVFAVADSDEWADAAHWTGRFDSPLVGPVHQLNGASTARVTYASHYVANGPQTGDVYVSFDGGAPRLLKSYRAADVNQVESLTVNVPAGATTAQLRFRCTGTDSAFWAVDQVSLIPPS